MNRLLPALCLALCLALCTIPALAQQHAVVLLYHHVSGETPASTSVTPGRFEEHLDHLVDSGFVVMPLSDILGKLYAGAALPHKAVAITFDDAYESVFHEAAPRLARRQLPYTVFVATDAIDEGYAGYMSWAQMRELDGALASFGAHSLSHAHLVERRVGETATQWDARVEDEIRGSVERLRAQLGVEVDSFAYPYGEYDEALMDKLRAASLYGLAQHSGAVGPGVDAREIPRFPMATGYDDLARFKTAITSRPMPVDPAGPNATVVTAGTEIPESFLLRFSQPLERASELACYGAGARLPLTAVSGAYRVDLPPLHAGRNKINCTAPAGDSIGGYYWYSRLWIVADKQGVWLRQ